MGPKLYFVTAIGTGCGKTVVSAVITEALQADYWKPIQCGVEDIDRETVQSLVSNPESKFHKERYLLTMPASPLIAAKKEGLHVQVSDFSLPVTKNHLVIEGAGGVLVPMNISGEMVIDIAQKFEAEVIIVSNTYLGSINHTLLTIQELLRRGLRIKGIVFNGHKNPDAEEYMLNYTGLDLLMRIETAELLDKSTIKKWAASIMVDLT
jgi:dethiobiotin synthetase